MVSIKEMGRLIKSFLQSNEYYRGIHFELYEDRHYVSYISDELNGIFLRGFGGDYESNITFRYSEIGLQMEVYLSNNKARRVGANLIPVIREEMMGENIVSLSTTRFIPGQSSMTFTLTLPINSNTDPRTAISILGNLTACIAFALAKY